MPDEQVVYTVRKFYPPQATSASLHTMNWLDASTPEECSHLERLGWVPAETFETALRQAEKASADKVREEAEKARAREEREAKKQEAAHAEAKAQAEAEAQAEAIRKAKADEREARVNFLITAGLTHKQPLEDRGRTINDQLRGISHNMRFAADEEREQLALELLALLKEQRVIAAQIVAVDRQLHDDIQEAAGARV